MVSFFRDKNGSALFLILIAVALFAALSYAVTNSGRGSSGIDREQADLAAAQLMQYSAMVASAVQRMQIIGGISDEQLDFNTDQRLLPNNSVFTYDNTLCTDSECEVYSPAGGGISYTTFEDMAEQPGAGQKGGHTAPLVEGIVNLGSDLPEIILRVSSIKDEICDAINRKLGLPLDPAYNFTGETAYTMKNDPTAALAATDARIFGDDETDLIGQPQFCIRDLASHNFYYHVLVIR